MDEQLGSLAEARGKLRKEWKALYRDVYTAAFMEVDLGFRFDAEPGIIEVIQSWKR